MTPAKLIFITLLSVVLLLIDFYFYQALKIIAGEIREPFRSVILKGFWIINILSILGIFVYNIFGPAQTGDTFRQFLPVWVFMLYFAKTFAILFILTDDLFRGALWLWGRLFPENAPPTYSEGGTIISRSSFLMRLALIAGSIPLISMLYGIISGAHDYRISRRKIKLPNLPDAFNGLKIAQISDIHSGSFFDKKAVERGVKMLTDEKADLVFFTGDLVNNEAREMDDYREVFSKISAPMGVYSVLGNHDYGDYISWPSEQAKEDNLETLKNTHREMGWDLLMNENRILEREGQKIAILGIENWGAKARFPKYGKMTEAHAGTENIPVKLLLSHDPSHWDAEVRTKYPDIDVMFAGHTHGMQFGLRLGKMQWSPVQYVYDQWSGLYQKGKQYLYVNRGFGYLGFPGRIGMPPEITVLELTNS